jgi:hypothetical protein
MVNNLEKMNRVFFPDRVGDEKDIPQNLDKSSFRIVKNNFVDMELDSRSVYLLMLDLVRTENKGDRPIYVYALKSIQPIYQFLCDNEIDLRKAKNGPIEELVGKEVIGFTPKGVNENEYPINIDEFVKCLKIYENADGGKK